MDITNIPHIFMQSHRLISE